MRNIYAIGESLVDIIFSNGEPKAAKAGGSMLNTAVSLGRIGLPVSMITEYGEDDPGGLIDSFLKSNGVETDHVFRFKNGKTTLALAFLDEKNDASYTFYKDYPKNRLDIVIPEPGKNDILLYGSIYSITGEIRKNFLRLIHNASKSGAMRIYDPNFRKAHLNEIEKLRPMIIENLSHASLVRGSDEDFMNIFGTENANDSWKIVGKYCDGMVYTANASGVSVRTNSFSGTFPVKKIKPVSTIGAGDNFNAGLIASFYSMGIMAADLLELDKTRWEEVISTATDFASNVCLSYDNYIDLAFASKYRSASRLQM
jgi:fructokinase